jgi:predicted deacylase
VTATFPPIEIEFPDLARWAAGNAGLPYVWTLTADRAGPHVLVQALTHGNEVCGAIALDWLLTEAFRPARGTVTLCFANFAAYDAFDPADPFASRCVEEDFNRLWTADVLDGLRRTADLARARELRPCTIASITCSISTR